MHGSLFFSRGSNLGNVLRTVAPMSSSVELALSALVLQLTAVCDAVPFFSAVEALVASLCGSFPFVFLLLVVPRKGANVVGFGTWS